MKFITSIVLLAITLQAFAALKVCYSSGDPHYQTFGGKRYDNMWEGTFAFAKTKNFLVHIKTGIWNKNTAVTVATAINHDGTKFVFNDRYNNFVKVDGERIKLNHGANKVQGLVLDKQGSTVYARHNNEWVSIQVNYDASWERAYGQEVYQNVGVFGEEHAYGICGDKGVYTATGIFEHNVQKKVVGVAECLKNHVEEAKKRCQVHFSDTNSQRFEWCVYDTCQGLKAEWVANYYKQVQYFKGVIAQYEVYKRQHNKLANEYLNQARQHLKQMKVHSQEYRRHAREVRRLTKERDAHNGKAGYHRKQHLKHKGLHAFHSQKAKQAYAKYIQFKKLAENWNKVIKHAQEEIEECEEEIEENKEKEEHAKKQFRIENAKALIALKVYNFIDKVAKAHKSAYEYHQEEHQRHTGYSNKNQREINYHHQQMKHHENLRKHFEKQKNHHQHLAGVHSKHSEQYSNQIDKVERLLKEKIDKQEEERKSQVKVLKHITVPSRTCKTVPEYLDSIKFSSNENARRHALHVCRHHNQNVYYSCVYDHSRGIFNTKQEFERLALLLQNSNTRHQCYSVGDPHNKPFIGSQFDVYHQQGWRSLLKTRHVEVNEYLGFSRTWGQRSLNRHIEVKYQGTVSLFNPHGHVQFVHNPSWVNVHNQGHYKEWKKNCGNYEIRITWRNAEGGGYYDVFITTNLGNLAGCTGDCCNKATEGVSENAHNNMKNGNPNAVEFAGRCERKTRAYRNCVWDYRTVQDHSHKQNLIKNCVFARKDK